jgi:hypothetical protein
VTKWRMCPVAHPYPSSGTPGAPCIQPPAPRMSPCGSRASRQLPQASSSGLAREFRGIARTRTEAGLSGARRQGQLRASKTFRAARSGAVDGRRVSSAGIRQDIVPGHK